MAKGTCSSCCCKFWGCIVFLLLLLAIVLFVLWLLIRPNALRSYAESAELRTFNFTGSTLDYDIRVQLSIRNPSHRVHVLYDRLDATASYGGQRIGHDNQIPDFRQGSKNTSYVDAVLIGRKVVVDKSTSLAEKFQNETRDGFFQVDVKLSMRVRFKVWSVKTNKYRPKIRCALQLPAPGSSPAFNRTKCDVDF